MAEVAGKFIFKMFLRESGPAGSTEVDMNTDSDATDSVFAYTVPIGKTALIQRINFQMVDSSMGALDFGGIASGLSAGITIKAYNHEGGVTCDFLDGQLIKRNTDFALLAGADIVITELAGDDQLPVRWTISKAGAPLLLRARESLKITIQDDLSAITVFRAMVQGIYE